MRSATRTVAAVAPAAAVVAAAWLRAEQPLGSFWRPAALVALVLAAAALPGWRLRAAATVVAAVVATRLALGIWLLPTHLSDPAGGFGLGGAFRDFGTRFGNGFLDFYDTHLPFDPRVHVEMGEVVLAALFCFALLVALLAAARKPVAAALALLVGAGWPATLLGPSHGMAMGAAILAAGLVLLAGLGSARAPLLAAPVAAVVVLAAVAVGSATASRHGLVRWQAWNPARGSTPASVGFVWTSQYAGLNWPRRRTVVLSVQSQEAPAYLRAAVLDDFYDDRWQLGVPRPADSLEPRAARLPKNQTRQVVTVQGLADTHLVGGSVPVRFSAGGAPIEQPQPGFALLPAGLARGFRYTVWSYAPRPTAAELGRSRPDYPAELLRDGMLGVGAGLDLPRFGAPQRARTVEVALTRTPQLYRYLPLMRTAERVAGGARTPYAAVADLERWFLGGGFHYSNHPLVLEPPLVGFVTRTHAGYCQYFAGAMALMLRYLGIPARVAVGFANGTYDAGSRAWLVSDHDAHAWVEVWFRGYGWLPFDPTPPAPGSTRAPLVSTYVQRGGSAESVPSPGIFARAAAKIAAQGEGGGAGGGAGPLRRRATNASGSLSARETLVLAVLLVLGATAGGIAATKHGLHLARRLERDPRRMAAACREELAAFLVDQRIEPARSATLHELGELVRRELGVDATAFVAAATAARFGRAERAPAAARGARSELRSLLAACRRSLTRRERLAGFLSLRSLARPRAAVAGSASLETTGSWRSPPTASSSAAGAI